MPSASETISISIHAPREGSDLAPPVCLGERGISIHAPREGSDILHSASVALGLIFLSTLPARGATSDDHCASPPAAFLSTLPARGATGAYWYSYATDVISIHAPREGSDSRGPSLTSPLEVFLSTLPARGATASG